MLFTQHISDEDAVELGRLERFGQLNPVLYVVESPGLVVGMLP